YDKADKLKWNIRLRFWLYVGRVFWVSEIPLASFRRRPNMKTNFVGFGIVCCLASLMAANALGQADKDNKESEGSSGDQMGDVAKKLNNPVANLISVPFQNDFDFGGGPKDNGFQYELKFQPVVPISITTNWNVIARMIMPYVYQEDRIGNTSQSGLTDTT